MLQPFSTCDFCDAHKKTDPAEFRVLPPVFKDFGQQITFAGPVVTVQCYEDNSLVKACVDSSGIRDTVHGQVAHVLVVDGGASLRKALLGGNLASSAARNGWAGIVVNGCVRDVAELVQQAIGIRAMAAVPMSTEKRGTGQQGLPIQIQGVWVYPGDWLYADADGMVVSNQQLHSPLDFRVL